MRALLRFVGRLLFVTVLLSSAVLKIKQPAAHTTEVTDGYNTIRGLHPTLTDVIPPITTVSVFSFRLLVIYHYLLSFELLELLKH